MTHGTPRPGFYPQPNEWTCGPYALKHALLALGRAVDVDHIARVAKTRWWSGTSEMQLTRAARALGCDLVRHTRGDAVSARAMLVRHVQRRVPVLLCVEEWTHWVTVVRHDHGRFVVVDSTADPPFTIRGWRELERWWRYHDGHETGRTRSLVYDLMTVRPRAGTDVHANLSIARVRFLRRAENRRLAHHWDEYLTDLLEIGRAPSGRLRESAPMSTFLRRHAPLLARRVAYWHGAVSVAEVARVLRDLRFVAATYGLVVPTSMERQALADLAILLALWACADQGIEAMFGARGSRVQPRR